MTRGVYNTRQKRDLLAFLNKSSEDHYSLDELVFKLKESGENMGRSTVYRFLEQLSEQGAVRKYQNAQGVTLYQLLNGKEDCDAHFHMMCRECGTLFHVNCDLMNNTAEHIMEHHGFRLDPRESILVGICAACRGEDTDHGTDHCEGCHDHI